jgi:5-methylcytosine-specific restriction protein A
MPFAAKKPCAQHGCPKLVNRTERWCFEHRKANTARSNRDRKADPVKRERDRFYDTAAWKRLRLWQLSEFPLCKDCEARGLLVSASQADHIQSIASGGAALDADNLQSLCQPCHSKKTRSEGGATW